MFLLVQYDRRVLPFLFTEGFNRAMCSLFVQATCENDGVILSKDGVEVGMSEGRCGQKVC